MKVINDFSVFFGIIEKKLLTKFCGEFKCINNLYRKLRGQCGRE